MASNLATIKLGGLSPTRDFTYVSDTVRGFIAALEYEKGAGQFIQLGSNFEISIAQLTQMIAKLMQKEVQVITEEQRLRPKDSEVERLWADNSKAKELLGWRPEFSSEEGLTKGLLKTIEWFLEPKNIALYKTNRYNI